ncbi:MULTISPECIES: helix-turn-helix domain-containing protein [Nocardia]|uniref:helix-turn-helix domain-containing protein n=1 Tax=Nocardia TaxID=1817 RepID=UPI000BEFFB9E|nr:MULTISPECIES: helix-turn-helix transcriptional regulator [Nocardia]MBF6068183.1 helix-turn-helix transcriptional regulator [Nocardia farcinica]MBF6186378.1 helix-turn-helix transcriptional regulator [Nocardia farcinica]MBF6257751.1 helix-turn-helix transcriptional regulator [Nocardia farcinica]MBF6313928.1 helix-turn-helix transcriptional regulator [Nocardia farcinica]MBF6409362.1 helix-turn-helix transcriptional regulator [Nocardia farcinica]
MTNVNETRHAFGQQLRDLRKDAGLSGSQLAERAGWQPSKVSKIEHGKQTPTEDDIRAWCQHTDATAHVPDLIATLRNIDAAYLEWRRILGTGIRRRQRHASAVEADTKLIRGYDPALIPGLLHTPEYAAAIFRQVIEFNQIPNDVDAAVAARMERQQQFLYRGDHKVHYLIGEQALYTTVGDNDVMLGQLDRLMTAMTLPRVVLGIVPRTAPYRVSATNFVIYDRRQVLVEGIGAAQTITQPREIVVHERAFEALAQQAAIGHAARTLITAALNTRTT